MNRLAETVIELINELHTERLNYESEYLPLIEAANRLAAYEDSGLEPEEAQQLVNKQKWHVVADGVRDLRARINLFYGEVTQCEKAIPKKE